MIAKEALTPPCDARASRSPRVRSDIRVAGRLRRRPAVHGSAELPGSAGMRVLKFGGSSLATPERIRDVGRIVRSTVNEIPAVIVVSAFQGVTNQLLDCARLAERRDRGYEETYDRIATRHHSAIESLLGRHDGRRIRVLVDGQLSELRDTLHGIRLLGQCPP